MHHFRGMSYLNLRSVVGCLARWLPALALWSAVAPPLSAAAEPADEPRAAIEVDADYPGGNIVVQRIDGTTLLVRQDLRDTDGWWFYWNFRVRGAAGQRLRVQFDDPSPLGVRGPAISRDQGQTWSWLGASSMSGSAFECQLDESDGEVRFAFAMPYQLADWDRFIEARSDSGPGDALQLATLCPSRQGRAVPWLRVRPRTGESPRRVLVTARHHACETMASYVLEGFLEAWLTGRATQAAWPDDAELLVVPFVDLDGVENGDQGKNRRPRDHNRDYDGDGIYSETRAIRKLADNLSSPAWEVAIDLHCPWIRGQHNDVIYMVGSSQERIADEQQRFGSVLQEQCRGPLPYRLADNIPFGTAWNTAANFRQGTSFSRWAGGLAGVRLATTFEVPYATAGGQAVTPESARAFGRDLAKTLAHYLRHD